MRRLALGGALQIHRTAKGWSVEQAAVHAGLGHMTFRRLQDGYGVRNRTYGAIDALLELQPGTVKRALGDDLVMATLIRDIAGVDTKDVTTGNAAAFVERFAKATLSDTAKSTVGARTTVALHPAPSQVPEVHGYWRSTTSDRPQQPVSDLEATAALIDRLTARHLTPNLDAAVRALLAAMPDLIRRQAEDGDDGTDGLDADDHDHAVACSG